MMNKNRLKISPGFTIVEVMIAMLVMTFGVLAVSNMQSRSIGDTSNSEHEFAATTEMQSVIEEWSIRPYDQVAVGVNPTIDFEKKGIKYNIDIVVSDNTPINNCKEIDMVCTWHDSSKSYDKSKGAMTDNAVNFKYIVSRYY